MLSGNYGYMDGKLEARVITILGWKSVLFNIIEFYKEPLLPPHTRKRQGKGMSVRRNIQ